MPRSRRQWIRMVQFVLLSSTVVGCGLGAGSPGPSASAAATTAEPSPTNVVLPLPSPTIEASATPQASAAPDEAPSPSGWMALLSLAPCPVPRTTDPACLDANANGATPARTRAVTVGGQVRISATVDNAGTVTSPPITLLLFTFEPPMIGSFLKVVACGGCTVTARTEGIALQWSGVGPGDHELTATLQAIGHPTTGPGGATLVGDDYEWLAGFFALPTADVLGLPDGIDTSLAFALATGETTIHPT